MAKMLDDADDDGEQEYINYYECPRCLTSWEDRWTSTCNDQCPRCGLKEIEPYESEDA